jgi:NAD+ synthase (glutamine-hydrolysing)
VFCLDRKILLIRPKTYLADDGLYREGRFFTPWKFQFTLEEHRLTRVLADVTGQTFVKFGVGAIMVSESHSCNALGAATHVRTLDV